MNTTSYKFTGCIKVIIYSILGKYIFIYHVLPLIRTSITITIVLRESVVSIQFRKDVEMNTASTAENQTELHHIHINPRYRLSMAIRNRAFF